MNPKSLQRSGIRVVKTQKARLRGFSRKINAPFDGYLYLNLVRQSGSVVEGVLLDVEDRELEKLTQRELGYELVDVSESLIQERSNIRVYAFIAPDIDYPGFKVPRSYIVTCLAAVSEAERDRWLAETIITNVIEEDLNDPVYSNFASG